MPIPTPCHGRPNGRSPDDRRYVRVSLPLRVEPHEGTPAPLPYDSFPYVSTPAITRHRPRALLSIDLGRRALDSVRSALRFLGEPLLTPSPLSFLSLGTASISSFRPRSASIRPARGEIRTGARGPKCQRSKKLRGSSSIVPGSSRIVPGTTPRTYRVSFHSSPPYRGTRTTDDRGHLGSSLRGSIDRVSFPRNTHPTHSITTHRAVG